MSVITKQLHKMSFDKATKAAETLTSAPQVDEAQKAEYAAALSSHPDNPANQTQSTASNGYASHGSTEDGDAKREKVGRVWEEKIGGVGRDEITRRFNAKEITLDEAFAMNAQTDGLTIFCSAKSGWICIVGKGRFPANLHPELAERIVNDEIKALLAKHKAETDAAMAAAKAK